MRVLWPLITLCLVMAPASGRAQWTAAAAATTTEFRSLHAPLSTVVWAGGRGGVVARSIDGGQTFTVDTIPTATELFIVGIHGADSTSAHALATSFDGGLARIYRTRDGGRSWEARYEDQRPGVFMDALACWDVSRCLAFGDPVDGTFVVARTTDAGESWYRLPAARLPVPLAGEAGFAASGRALVTGPDGTAWFGTGGGERARVYRTDDYGDSWSVHDTPLPGGPTAGIFALAFREDGQRGLAVGGDYQLRTEPHPTVLATSDGGRTWQLREGRTPLPGVRYGVTAGAWNGAFAWLTAGPAGTMYSPDGRTWQGISDTGYNTVAAVDGMAFAAGPGGALARSFSGSFIR